MLSRQSNEVAAPPRAFSSPLERRAKLGRDGAALDVDEGAAVFPKAKAALAARQAGDGATRSKRWCGARVPTNTHQNWITQLDYETEQAWCERGDSNPHVFEGQQILSLPRLPIPPLSRPI